MRPPPPDVRVRPAGARRIRGSHPWVFRDDVGDTGAATHGDSVRVLGERGGVLGHAFYSAHSKITLRMITRGDGPPVPGLFAARAEAALRYRDQVVEGADAYRLFYAESDGIPGLVIDRYGTHLVVQTLTAASERVLPEVLDHLGSLIRVESVLARNDPAVRALEGLPREIVQLRGKTPDDLIVHEGPVRYRVDVWRGQKTGAFLDHRENRLAAGRLARGRVLDVFAYHGSFALHAAAFADEVEAIDSSEEALLRGAANAHLNGLANVRFAQGNAFDALRARDSAGERYDLVFLDPPAFAKSRADLEAARRGYKEINLRAMRLLGPRGILVTSSCSYNLSESELIQILGSAAADAGRSFRVVERRTQSRDHPIRLGFPESHYLKCLVLSLV